jgi:hypothetical protein
MNLLRFLLTNWDSVLVVIAAIVVVIVLVKRGETAFLKDILFRFVTKAEQEFGGGTGELKKAAVIELVYDKLPAVLRLIITRKDLDKMIDDVLLYAKTKWAANDKLNALVSNKAE